MKKIIITALVVGGVIAAFAWVQHFGDQVTEEGKQMLVLWDKTEALIGTAPRGFVPQSCSMARSNASELRALLNQRYKTPEKMEAQKALATQAKVCVTDLQAANK
jgi:hypothetical protein